MEQTDGVIILFTFFILFSFNEDTVIYFERVQEYAASKLQMHHNTISCGMGKRNRQLHLDILIMRTCHFL